MSNIDDTDLREIGRMVVACSGVEFTCWDVLGALMDVHVEEASAKFAGKPHSWVLNKMAAAVALLDGDPALREEWERWITDAQLLNERRNDIVHSLWIKEGEFSSELLTRIRRESIDGGRRRLPGLDFVHRGYLTRIGDDADALKNKLHALVWKSPGLLKTGAVSDGSTEMPVSISV